MLVGMIPRILGRRLGLTASSPSPAEWCEEVERAEMAGESDAEGAETAEERALPTAGAVAARDERPVLNGAARSVFRLGYPGGEVSGEVRVGGAGGAVAGWA